MARLSLSFFNMNKPLSLSSGEGGALRSSDTEPSSGTLTHTHTHTMMLQLFQSDAQHLLYLHIRVSLGYSVCPGVGATHACVHSCVSHKWTDTIRSCSKSQRSIRPPVHHTHTHTSGSWSSVVSAGFRSRSFSSCGRRRHVWSRSPDSRSRVHCCCSQWPHTVTAPAGRYCGCSLNRHKKKKQT